MPIRVPALAGSFLLSLTTIAAAQEAVPPVEPETVPVFRALGPDGASSGGGAEVQIVMPPEGSDNPLYRLELHGEYVDPRSHFGGFASISLGHYSEDGNEFDDGESFTALSDLEIGGLYRHVSGQTSVTGRIALVLPTAPDDEFPVPLYAALFADPSDAILGLPETTSLRAAVSPGWTDGRFFVRGDLGLDATLDTPSSEFDGEEEDLQVLHVDGGFGAVAGNVAGAFELQNAWLMGDGETIRVNHVGATVQYATPQVNVYGGLGKVFIEDEDSFLDDEDIWDLTLGVRGRL